MIPDSQWLCYRPLQASDHSRLNELLGNREVMANTLLDPPSEAGVRRWLQAAVSAAADGVSKLAVIERSSGLMIGYCGVEKAELQGRWLHEFGLMLLPQYWGRGYGSEAARAVLVGQQQHYRIGHVFAVVKQGHRASVRVLSSAGMQFVRDSDYAGQAVQIWQRNADFPAQTKTPP